jgi:hypothetical protein
LGDSAANEQPKDISGDSAADVRARDSAIYAQPLDSAALDPGRSDSASVNGMSTGSISEVEDTALLARGIADGEKWLVPDTSHGAKNLAKHDIPPFEFVTRTDNQLGSVVVSFDTSVDIVPLARLAKAYLDCFGMLPGRIDVATYTSETNNHGQFSYSVRVLLVPLDDKMALRPSTPVETLVDFRVKY